MRIKHSVNNVTCPAELFAFIFRHLKLELLTQFPASNDEKYLYSWKNRHLQYQIIVLTKHLPKDITID